MNSISIFCYTTIYSVDYRQVFVNSTNNIIVITKSVFLKITLLIFGLLIVTVESNSLDASFTIKENIPINSRVGILVEVIETFRYKAGIHFHLQQIDYQSDKPMFKINKYSGVINTASKIDREKICPKVSGTNLPCSVSLVVSVVEYVINVKIVINDLNDNPPTFSTSTKIIQISEDERIGFYIELEQAIDLDSAINGIETYRLLPSTMTPFKLLYKPSDLRLILHSKLDYEKVKLYNLKIQACDSGKVCASQLLKVEVVNVNDEAPKFEHKNYTIFINETTKVGAKLTKITAVDREEGDFGRIKYKLGNINEYGSNFVKIDENTGYLYLTKSLNGIRELFVNVEAQDMAKSPKFDWTKVHILVIDVNNHYPEIKLSQSSNIKSNYISKSQYLINIPENRPKNDIIVFINVRDNDLGPNGEAVCLFNSKYKANSDIIMTELSSKSSQSKIYKLLTNKVFDKENADDNQLSYALLCYDKGQPKLETSIEIKINIIDCNEYPSYFDKRLYEIQIVEESVNDETLLFTLSDADATSENIFMLSGTYSDHFVVRSEGNLKGKLTVFSPIDREKVDRFEMKLKAINIGLFDGKNYTATSTILVIVLDINDNYPQLVGRSEYEIMENSQIGTILGKVNVKDKDLGMNSIVSLNRVWSSCINNFNPEPLIGGLTTSSMSTFSPVPLSVNIEFIIDNLWNIKTTTLLDYEKIQQCQIRLLVSDMGSNPSPLSSTLTVTVNILDENDNAPHFIFPSPHDYQLNLSTTTSSNTRITRIRAVDIDNGGHENLTYKLHSGINQFQLDASTGQLTALSSLKHGVYRLLVSAHDSSIPVRSIYSNLTLNVLPPNSKTAKLSSHILLILGLIPACALIILICAVIPIVFLIKWHKRNRNREMCRQSTNNIPNSVQSPLYHCPDIEHNTQLNDEECQKESIVMLKSDSGNYFDEHNCDSNNNPTFFTMTPDLQNIAGDIARIQKTIPMNTYSSPTITKSSFCSTLPLPLVTACSTSISIPQLQPQKQLQQQQQQHQKVHGNIGNSKPPPLSSMSRSGGGSSSSNSNVATTNSSDIDVCSADSGQGASVDDPAASISSTVVFPAVGATTYFKPGQFDQIKFNRPYQHHQQHWCPPSPLPEDCQIPASSSSCWCNECILLESDGTVTMATVANPTSVDNNNSSNNSTTKHPFSQPRPLCQVHFPFILKHSLNTHQTDAAVDSSTSLGHSYSATLPHLDSNSPSILLADNIQVSEILNQIRQSQPSPGSTFFRTNVPSNIITSTSTTTTAAIATTFTPVASTSTANINNMVDVTSTPSSSAISKPDNCNVPQHTISTINKSTGGQLNTQV